MRIKSLIFKTVKRMGLGYPFLKGILFFKGRLGIKSRSYPGLHTFYKQFITPESLVFDIGANLGDRTEVFLDSGKKVVSVEPNPELAKILRMRFSGRPNFELVNKGCGARNEFQEFSIGSNHLLSSFSTEFMDHKKKLTEQVGWSRKIKVEIVTLDDLVSNYGIPQFCKIDVEGYEEQVFQGLTQKIGCISYEFNSPTFNSQTEWCAKKLAGLGYHEFNISFAESLKLEFNKWIPLDELVHFIQTTPKMSTASYGDVYAR